MNTKAKTFEAIPRKCVDSCRLEKRLASRRARLVELTQQMEKERENQDKNDPEAMKTLSRGQVSWHCCGMHMQGALLFLAFHQTVQWSAFTHVIDEHVYKGKQKKAFT